MSTNEPKAKLSGIPLSELSGSRATEELHRSIITFQGQNDKQTRTIVRLTWAMLFLTLVMLLMAGAQIYFAWLALPKG